jgi:hypothetical protein
MLRRSVPRLGLSAIAVSCFAVLALGSSPASAIVTLALSDNDATPTSARVGPNGSIVLTVRLNSNSEQTTGLDYYLRVSGPGSGHFRILDRNLVGSAYPVPYQDDTTVEQSPGSLLNTDNDFDLGGAVANVNVPNGTGTFTVANITIGVEPTAPIGFYTISTFSQPGTGWVGVGSPIPTEGEFFQHGSFLLEVPEPTALGLLPLAAAAFIRRRRRGLCRGGC